MTREIHVDNQTLVYDNSGHLVHPSPEVFLSRVPATWAVMGLAPQQGDVSPAVPANLRMLTEILKGIKLGDQIPEGYLKDSFFVVFGGEPHLASLVTEELTYNGDEHGIEAYCNRLIAEEKRAGHILPEPSVLTEKQASEIFNVNLSVTPTRQFAKLFNQMKERKQPFWLHTPNKETIFSLDECLRHDALEDTLDPSQARELFLGNGKMFRYDRNFYNGVVLTRKLSL